MNRPAAFLIISASLLVVVVAALLIVLGGGLAHNVGGVEPQEPVCRVEQLGGTTEIRWIAFVLPGRSELYAEQEDTGAWKRDATGEWKFVYSTRSPFASNTIIWNTIGGRLLWAPEVIKLLHTLPEWQDIFEKEVPILQLSSSAKLAMVKQDRGVVLWVVTGAPGGIRTFLSLERGESGTWTEIPSPFDPAHPLRFGDPEDSVLLDGRNAEITIVYVAGMKGTVCSLRIPNASLKGPS